MHSEENRIETNCYLSKFVPISPVVVMDLALRSSKDGKGVIQLRKEITARGAIAVLLAGPGTVEDQQRLAGLTKQLSVRSNHRFTSNIVTSARM